MLSVPASMQPTLDSWNKTRNLEGAMRFTGGYTDGSQYLERMDQVITADNGDNDADSRKGILVCKDDQETHRYTGDAREGTLESVTADGTVYSLHIDKNSIDNLQLTQNNGGVEVLHEHFDRNGGKNWMAVGGAVTVIDLDQNPDALVEAILGKPSAEKTLASKLGTDVKVISRDAHKGFNAGNCGFAVQGELQMAAWTQGVEIKFEAGGEKYVYRGLDETTGRFGVDVEHEGYWKQDERGIYVPDKSASSGFGW